MSWPIVAIGDISHLVTKGTTPTTMGEPFTDQGIRFIKAEALNGDTCLSQSGMVFIDEETHQLLKRSIIHIDDVLITIAGAQIGRCGYVTEEHLPANTNQAVGIVRIDRTKALPRFVYYFFRQPDTFKAIQSLGGGQAAQPNLNLANLKQIKLRLPSIGTQQSIVNVLSTYNDLIENNRRRMSLLEASARLLYREWFVRLRFPGCEHTSITDGVPEGWVLKSLGDLCREIRESVSPDKLEPDTPYIGLEHMPRRSISLGDWGTVEQVSSSKHRFLAGEILFGKIRPYFHKVGVAFVDGVASSDAIVIRPAHESLHGFVLMTVSSDEFVAVTSQAMKEGSKMPRADWKHMQTYAVALPPAGLLSSFDSAIQPIIGQLKTLSLSNQKLRTARDLLLPCLMSGEIAA